MANTAVDEPAALEFDGTSAYVDLGNPAVLQFPALITLEAWVKPTAIDGFRYILAHGYTSDPAAEVALRLAHGQYAVGSWDGTDHYAVAAIPPGDVGQWVHLAGVYDGRRWILYRNGQVVGQQPTAKGALAVTAHWAIGAVGGGTERFFAGRIRQVAIWHAPRTPDQIAQDMHDPTAAPGQGDLVGYWPLDDGAGDAVRDRSGRGNLGVRMGAAWITPPALSLNGATSYVDLGNPPSLALSGVCSLEAWIKPAATDGLRNIVAHGYTANPPGEVYLRLANGQYQVGSWDGADHFAAAAIPPGDVGHWVHLAGSFDGQHWILYRNGREVGRSAGGPGAVPVNAPWAIGARGGGGERFFAGLVRQVAIWNVAADPATLAARVAGTLLNGTEPGLVGYWPLAATLGTTAAGRAPTPVAGTVQHGVWGQPYLTPQARLLADYIPGPDPQIQAQHQQAQQQYEAAQRAYTARERTIELQLSKGLPPPPPLPLPVRPAVLDAPIPNTALTPATGYRTVVTANSSSRQFLPCQMTVTATAPVTLYFLDGTSAPVDANQSVTRATDAQGTLSFFVPAGTGLMIPLLKVHADFMLPGEQMAIAADQGFHRQLAGLTANQLLGRDAAGQPMPGQAPLAAPGTPPAQAESVAQVVRQVMGAVASGGLQADPAAGAGTRDLGAAPRDLEAPPAPVLPAVMPGSGPDGVAAYLLPAEVPLVRMLGAPAAAAADVDTRDILGDISGFFTHTIPDTVNTAVNAVTGIANTVPGGVTSTITTITDGTQQAVAAIRSGGTVVVNTATTVSQQVQGGFETLAVDVRSASGQVSRLVLTTAHDAAMFTQGVLDQVGAAAQKVLDFFKDLFAWDDIWNTAQVYQHLVRQMVPALQSMLAQNTFPRVQQILRDQRTTITQALDSVQSYLQDRTPQNLRQPPAATPGDPGGGTDPRTTAYMTAASGGGVQDNWLLRQILANIGGDFGLGSAPPLAVGTLGDQLSGAVTQSGLLTALPQAGQAFLDFIQSLARPDDITTVSVAQLVALLKNVVLLALDAIDALLTAMLDLLSAGLGGLDAVLTHPLTIPFVSDFYKRTISQGQDLTIVGLCAVLAAAVATPAYKAAHGSAPPFSAGQVQTALTLQVPAAGGTRDLAASADTRDVSDTFGYLKLSVGAATIFLTYADVANDVLTFPAKGDEKLVVYYGWQYNLAAAVIAILSEPDWLVDSAYISWDSLDPAEKLNRASWVLNWIPLAASVILLCPPILTNDRAQEWGKVFLSVSTLPAWACGLAGASLAVDAARQGGDNIWANPGGTGWPLLTTIFASMSTVLQFMRLKVLNTPEDYYVPLVSKELLTGACDALAGIFQGLA